jgi:hypothetical protein
MTVPFYEITFVRIHSSLDTSKSFSKFRTNMKFHLVGGEIFLDGKTTSKMRVPYNIFLLSGLVVLIKEDKLGDFFL